MISTQVGAHEARGRQIDAGRARGAPALVRPDPLRGAGRAAALGRRRPAAASVLSPRVSFPHISNPRSFRRRPSASTSSTSRRRTSRRSSRPRRPPRRTRRGTCSRPGARSGARRRRRRGSPAARPRPTSARGAAARPGSTAAPWPATAGGRRSRATDSCSTPRATASSPGWKSNLQPDFKVSVFESFDASSSTLFRDLDESDRFVQKSAESTSI